MELELKLKLKSIGWVISLIAALQFARFSDAKEAVSAPANKPTELAAIAAPFVKEQHWRIVLFNGQKVGHAFAERTRENGEFINREVMDLEIKRGPSEIKLYTEQVFRENAALEPTGFAMRMRASELETLVQGSIGPDRQMQIMQTVGGVAKQLRQALPEDVLFPEAQIKKLQALGFKPGAVVSFNAFDPSSMETFGVVTTFKASKAVDLVTETRQLFEVKQTISYPQATLDVQAFVDPQFNALKTRLDMMGITLEITEATRTMALAPNQTVDELARMMLKSPRALSQRARDIGLRYTLKHKGEGALDSTDEQRVQAKLGGFIVDVCDTCGAASALTAADRVRYMQASSYLQSDAPAMQKAAQDALSKLSKTERAEPRQVMQTLENFVRGHISDKNLDVGYASALEVLNNPSGDCTEHAVLLAALGRAAGVPTRVAAGFAYAPEYLGYQRAFVPHAWAQAYLNGRWHSFDAALEGFDAGHLTIETGDGDPSRFYGSIHLLGNLEIIDLRPLTPAEIAR